MNQLPVLILVNRSASAFAYSCCLTKESDRKGRWQIINLTQKRNVCSCTCAWPSAHTFACVSVCLAALLHPWMWPCVHACGSGVSQKGAIAPAAWAVKPALYPLLFPSLDLIYPCQCVARSLSLSLCSIALTCTCGTSSRLVPTLGPHSVFLRFIAPALNFCKQLTQPAPVLQAGKDST